MIVMKMGLLNTIYFCRTDSKLVMKLMSTYASISPSTNQEDTDQYMPNTSTQMFKYTCPEPLANHYAYYCHKIDNHNNLFHHIVGLSMFYPFKWLCLKLMLSLPSIFYLFYQKLPLQLIENELQKQERKSDKNKIRSTSVGDESRTAVIVVMSKTQRVSRVYNCMHELYTAPVHAIFFDGKRWISATHL